MTAPVYNQVDSRLYALSSMGDVGVTGYWAGYYASAQAQLGLTASIASVWNDVGGVYLFLQQTPIDFTALATALQDMLPVLSPQGWLRFLWISNSNPLVVDWQVQTLEAYPSGSEDPLQWRVIRQKSFRLGAYSVWIQGGSLLTLANEDSQGYGACIPATTLNFYTPGCGYPAQDVGLLAFSGSLLGALAFPILLNHQQGDDFTQMGVQVRYTIANELSQFGETKSLSMPILANPDGVVIPASFAFDPLNPLLAARSGVVLYTATGSNPVLSSAFVTTCGYAITLTPGNGGGVLAPARLGFCKTPLLTTFIRDTLDVMNDYYLTPDGAFTLQVVMPVPPPIQTDHYFMFGISGIEAVRLDTAGHSVIFFQSNQPAYIPSIQVDGEAALQMQATTAYATVLPATVGTTGLTYYAQSLQAPLFRSTTTLGTGFMDFHAMPSGVLSSYSTGGTAPVVLPVGAYKWLLVEQIEFARKIEEAVLAPRRRGLVAVPVTTTAETLSQSDSPNLASVGANPYLAVTPQGLIAKLTTDLQSWAGITVANMPASINKEVEFTAVGSTLQAALQANQLFFVVSNVDTFMKQSSVRYQLTALDLELLAAQGVPSDFITTLTAAYGTMPTQIYETEQAFLQPYPPNPDDPNTPLYQSTVLAVAGLLETDMDGWTFQLSPRSWRSGSDSPTMMLFKFCNRSLVDLVNDTHAWNWPEAAEDRLGSLVVTQKRLQDFFKDAALHAQPESNPKDPLGVFYRETASNPFWNGVLFLNVPVDFTAMPAPLQFLTAGMDTAQFYAHHIGFAVTPFVPQADGIDLKQTAAFGLINYNDTADLVASSSIAFGFKTLQLKVGFANAKMVDFTAQVELMCNELLGSPLNKQDATRGNNLIMQGSCQGVGGVPTYNFTLTGENVFSAQNTILLGVEVLSVQLLSGGANALETVETQFILMGNLSFALMEAFDLFSYGPSATEDGYLRFGTLGITMSFQHATPTLQTWSINENSMTFDTLNSVLRTTGLANNFPLLITNLMASPNLAKENDIPKGLTPEDMGYTSISCPLEQTIMTAPWYGLVFSMDLGSLGALADSVGFSVSVLAAWRQGQTQFDMPVYLGLKLPNIPALGGSIALQGILKLGFRSFAFSTYLTDHNELGYMLTLRRFALSILCWSFPPGNVDLCIFGAPDQPKSSVGWYAAYDSNEKKTSKDMQQIGSKVMAEKSAPWLASGPSATGNVAALPVNKKVQRRLRVGRRTPRVG